MAFEKVLVAYDGSAPSKMALEVARDLVSTGAISKVVLSHALLIPVSGIPGVMVDEVLIEDANNIQSELEAFAAELDADSEVVMLKGSSPAELIVAYAIKNGCDAIIMGSRGKGGVKGYLGSVSYSVTKQSPVTVIIAKEGARS